MVRQEIAPRLLDLFVRRRRRLLHGASQVRHHDLAVVFPAWIKPAVNEYVEVVSPATGIILAKTPLCGKDTIDAAAQAAMEAFLGWRRTPVQERIQFLFRLRDLLKTNLDEIARTITNECGKTIEESKAEMVSAIENVEVACGIPMMSKGEIAVDIAPGIDELMICQPVGMCATIAPFNFPGMIPF